MAEKVLCTIINKSKGKPARLPFDSIREKILGPKYELSVIFLSSSAQKKLNTTYRGKNKSTNILSFPLSKNNGEITFDLSLVKKESKDFDMTYPQFLKYLFIHGCLHLKGFVHSSTMEKEEKKYLKIFS